MPAQLVLQAMLLSPNFLYRREYGLPDPLQPGSFLLDPYELAQKLAFTLFGKGPDLNLLARVANHELDTQAGLEKVAAEMILDERALRGFERFAMQWLRTYQLDDVRRPPESGWSDATREALKEETRLLLGDHFSDVDVAGVLTAQYAYASAGTAPFYGRTLSGGPERIDFLASDERSGILTQPGFLMMTAREAVVTPILRGAFVRNVFLCSEPPPPPSQIPELSEPLPGQSVRERLAAHRESPACASCHELMDPIGFGFERYDSMGRLVFSDEAGVPVTGEGYIAGADESDFVGAPGLAKKLAEAPEFSSCLAKHYLRYAEARHEDDQDLCRVGSVTDTFVEKGRSLPDLAFAFVTDPDFRRTGAAQ